MDIITLQVEPRADVGKIANKGLRKSGFIPAVVYAEGQPSKQLAINLLHFQNAARNTRSTQLFKFESKEAALNGLTTLIKAMQLEPIKDRVVHIDFLAVTEGHRITVTVGLELVGECPAVKLGEAILNQTAHELEVECLPTEIPASLKVDISQLQAGYSIHAGDIPLPPNVALASDPEMTIVGAITKREEAAEQSAEAGAAAAATSTPEA